MSAPRMPSQSVEFTYQFMRNYGRHKLKEGLEINSRSLVYGINPLTFTLKLPGIGNIH
jgi:hypothetical protein